MGTPYQFLHLAAVLRDADIEHGLGLQVSAPSPQQHKTLVNWLSSHRVVNPALQERIVTSFQQSLVIADALTSEQRQIISDQLEPRYAAAILQDEEPRERFHYSECSEEMVDLSALARESACELLLSARPFDAACGPRYAGKSRIFWARASVAMRFIDAAKQCNSLGITPCVEDGFRPQEVQRGLFQRRYRMIREENPEWSAEQVLTATFAKTAGAPYRAAHMGGAAIDVTLWIGEQQFLDRPASKWLRFLYPSALPSTRFPNYRMLPLGNEYPTGGAATYLDFPYLSYEERLTRVLFKEIFELSGLVVYRGEDWHVSAGDSQAALINGMNEVRFCALESFDPLTGAVKGIAADRQRVFFNPLET